MIVTGCLLIDDLSKFLFCHVGQTSSLPLQKIEYLLDRLLSLREVRNEIGEVKGDNKDDDKKGNFAEDTVGDDPIPVVNPVMGRMLRAYQRFVRPHKPAFLEFYLCMIT
jgi:hypothetical protein